MPGGSKVNEAYGLGTESRGGSFESAPRFGLGGFGVAGALVAAAFSACNCWTCASSVCTRALIRSRSNRVSLRAGRVSRASLHAIDATREGRKPDAAHTHLLLHGHLVLLLEVLERRFVA